MAEKKFFYITTTIPYVNAEPHIGFALELIQADAIARFKRLLGKDVFFSTGTDEYGQKIWEASQKESKDTQDYVDYYAERYLELKKRLNLSYDNFIRTTSGGHILAAQEFWKLCDKKGDIYKKNYKGLYCVGCEKFLNEKDLLNGRCVLHPSLVPEVVEEENYFFKLSNYKEKLLEYLSREKVVFPEWRRKEAVEYVQGAMDDFSISRSKERVLWGVPIPGDETQVMYVWFGAFVNYISTLGWPKDKEIFKKFWEEGETVQTAGKDMVKFQSIMWQGMLMSAGLSTTDHIMYHGFITGNGGVRMSKSLGNVINPKDVAEEYGADALRFFLLREVSTFDDSPFSIERFNESYNANLANGLGNLTSRIMKLAETNLDKPVEVNEDTHETLGKLMENFEIQKAMNHIWEEIGKLDSLIQESKPWETKDQKTITELVKKLAHIGFSLQAFMPETSNKILAAIKENKLSEPLFPRKDA
ncbi:MAG: methionine--tRNA ligase [bacterium]|nr:methionine--tRNA ligase [bacterium]